MDTIQVHHKTFKKLISYEEIGRAITRVAEQIQADYADKPTPLFIGILNGSFMFFSELMQRIPFNCEVSFIRLASYQGTHSTGNIELKMGLSVDITGRDVILVEDIVDTGESIAYAIDLLQQHAPASVAVATLFFKPEAYTKQIPIQYYAMNVPNKFIVGFGLDYDQQGRNYRDIYELVSDHA